MPTNKKPVLSILVDGNKRDQFADLCSEHGRSMAWAVNAFIDHCLKNESIDLALNASPVAADSEWLTKLWGMVADIKQGIRRMELSTAQLAVDVAQVSSAESLDADKAISEIEDPLESLTEEEQAQIERKQQYIAEFALRYGGKISARNGVF